MKARLGAVLLLALLAIPATSVAQERSADEDARPGASAVVGQNAGEHLKDTGAIDLPAGPRVISPRFEAISLEPKVENRFATDDVALRPVTRGHASALMIAGAALLVTGILIEGDAGALVAVAGAGIGAYGLYLYFSV
ncbi:MAG: hypothetical protein ABFS34_09520 [Gemmatimonadota bacterium]